MYVTSAAHLSTRCWGAKLAIKHVGGNACAGGRIALRGLALCGPRPRAELGLPHQTRNPVASTTNALYTQFHLNPRTAIHPAMGDEGMGNPSGQFAIFPCASAQRTFFPGIIPAHGYVQYPAHHAHSILVSMRFDKTKALGYGCEKMATAFFRISRSCRTRSSSRFK